GERGIFSRAEQPQIAAHQSVGIAQSSIEDEFAAERWNPPHLAAESLDSLLKTIAEIRDFPSQAKVFGRIDQIETGGRGASQHILADSHERGAFERRHAVLAKTRHVELHDRARTTVRRFDRLVASGADEAVHAGFAIAQNRA